jgi:hypothetical protein
MSAEEILREYAARTGWDLASMLVVAADYIDRLNSNAPNRDGSDNERSDNERSGNDGGEKSLRSEEGFRAYVRDRAEDEAGMSDG